MLIWQLVLIQIVTFAFIILFLRWLLYSHISRALNRLRHLNQQNLEKERALKEEFERARREVEREIAEGRRQAEEIRRQAREEADKERENLLAKTKKESRRLVNEALKDLQREKNNLVLQMQERAVYLACDMIKYIFSGQGRENLHIKIVDELIDDIEKIEKEKFKIDGNEAELICAYPLEDRQRRKLGEIVSFKSGKNISLSERVDDSVIAGLIIKSSGFVIDGSIRNKLKKILAVMQEEAKTVQS